MEAGLKPQDGRALLSTLMVDPNLLHRFRALRDRVFPIKPSQYDVTNLCNLSCVGCLYFEGANAFVGKGHMFPFKVSPFTFQGMASEAIAPPA